MAYIQPNSVIQLFRGINLDNRYLHTIYFASASAQNTWFTSKVYKSFQQQSYTRYTRNSVKLKADTTELLGCTYLRFMNDRSVDMWFYAFITGIEYINENTALITYEIDVMQTWFIQFGSLQPCMVLREHVSDDTFGLNLEEEPIGSDVYDNDEIYYFGKVTGEDNPFSEYSVIMQTTGESQQNRHMIQGLFSGCNYIVNPADSQSDGNTIHAMGTTLLGSWDLQQQSQNIVDLYTIPSFCAEEREDPTTHEMVFDQIGHLATGHNIQIPAIYDTYTPKNKKLFMYPYSYLMVTTHMGDVSIYRWEYFDGTTGSDCEFEVDGTMLGGGEIRCYPRAYNGQNHNVDAGLVMGNFPKNTASYDAYQAWIAGGGSTKLENERKVNSVKGTSGIMSAVGGLLSKLVSPESSTLREHSSTDVGTFMGQPFVNQGTSQTLTTHTRGIDVGGVAGGVAGALNVGGSLMEAKNNMQYTFNDAKYEPDIVIGKATSSLPVAMRDANFYFFHCHIRDDEVKRIDDFFSCYGYSIKKVKQPNLTGRQYWNFVQTQGAVINGNMPASSKDAIARIFDSGITFWHNGDQIGNYAQSVSNGSINNPIVA